MILATGPGAAEAAAAIMRCILSSSNFFFSTDDGLRLIRGLGGRGVSGSLRRRKSCMLLFSWVDTRNH